MQHEPRPRVICRLLGRFALNSVGELGYHQRPSDAPTRPTVFTHSTCQPMEQQIRRLLRKGAGLASLSAQIAKQVQQVDTVAWLVQSRLVAIAVSTLWNYSQPQPRGNPRKKVREPSNQDHGELWAARNMTSGSIPPMSSALSASGLSAKVRRIVGLGCLVIARCFWVAPLSFQIVWMASDFGLEMKGMLFQSAWSCSVPLSVLRN